MVKQFFKGSNYKRMKFNHRNMEYINKLDLDILWPQGSRDKINKYRYTVYVLVAECLSARLVSQASRIFLYFRWEEREGEKNTSGHSGQLPVDIRTNAWGSNLIGPF